MPAASEHAEPGNPKCRSAIEQRRLVAGKILNGPGIQTIADEHHEETGDGHVAPLTEALGQSSPAVELGDQSEKNARRGKPNSGSQRRREILDGDFGE